MADEKKRGLFDRIQHAGIHPVCPKCGHGGFIALDYDAVVNASKSVTMITCSKPGCHAVVGVLPRDAL